MGNEEGGFNVAAIGILALSIEDVFIQADVVVVDCVIESYRNHLRHVFGWQIPRYGGSVLRAEAVRKSADRWVAGWGAVWIVVHIWGKSRLRQCVPQSFHASN